MIFYFWGVSREDSGNDKSFTLVNFSFSNLSLHLSS